jgi:hypothetical protein
MSIIGQHWEDRLKTDYNFSQKEVDKFYRCLFGMGIVQPDGQVADNYQHITIKSRVVPTYLKENEEIEVHLQELVLYIDDVALQFLVEHIIQTNYWKDNADLEVYLLESNAFMVIHEAKPYNELSQQTLELIKTVKGLPLPYVYYKHQNERTEVRTSTSEKFLLQLKYLNEKNPY